MFYIDDNIDKASFEVSLDIATEALNNLKWKLDKPSNFENDIDTENTKLSAYDIERMKEKFKVILITADDCLDYLESVEDLDSGVEGDSVGSNLYPRIDRMNWVIEELYCELVSIGVF